MQKEIKSCKKNSIFWSCRQLYGSNFHLVFESDIQNVITITLLISSFNSMCTACASAVPCVCIARLCDGNTEHNNQSARFAKCRFRQCQKERFSKFFNILGQSCTSDRYKSSSLPACMGSPIVQQLDSILSAANRHYLQVFSK